MPEKRTVHTPEGDRVLAELLRESGYEAPAEADDLRVRRIIRDSREVRPGDLFVAVRGVENDGHHHIADAFAAGAVAAVVEQDGDHGSGLLIHVEDSQQALARLASAWFGKPATRLPLIGITGTLGKTTVMMMLEAILLESGHRLGTIGSLGVRLDGREEETGYTAPDPIVLHQALAELVQGGARLAAMEVTTHALSQERVHGLEYQLGVFTNLVPLEHIDYHGSFRKYVEAKVRFFQHLKEGVPVVYSHDDRAVRGVVRRYPVQPVGVGQNRGARVRYEMQETTTRGSSFSIWSESTLPMLGGGHLDPFRLDLRLRAMGRSMVVNAALSATAALLSGASMEAVKTALGEFPAPRRRLEVLREEPFLVLDDTTGHPDSIGMVFDVVARLDRPRVHAIFAIRGQRGVRINRRSAEALAIWSATCPLDSLIITSSEDVADELNRVEPDEREAFLGELRDEGVEFEEYRQLRDAIRRVLERAEKGDLVLLLGAQGMDAGAEILEHEMGDRKNS